MTAEYRQALRLLAETLPAGTAIPVLREQLLGLLNNETGARPSGRAEPLLTADEVAERLAVDVQTVRRQQKQLGALKIGRSVRFQEQGVERFLTRRALK